MAVEFYKSAFISFGFFGTMHETCCEIEDFGEGFDATMNFPTTVTLSEEFIPSRTGITSEDQVLASEFIRT